MHYGGLESGGLESGGLLWGSRVWGSTGLGLPISDLELYIPVLKKNYTLTAKDPKQRILGV